MPASKQAVVCPCIGCYLDEGKALKLAGNFEPDGPARCRVLKALDGGGRFLRARKDFVSAYVETYEEGRLADRVVAARELSRSCQVCRPPSGHGMPAGRDWPRALGGKRLGGQKRIGAVLLWPADE